MTTKTKKSKIETAEELLQTVAASGEDLTFEQRVECCNALGCSDSELDKELRRFGRIVQQRKVAGTRQDRDKQDEEVRRLFKALNDRRPELEKQIAKLQSELAKLEQDHRLAAKRAEEMEAAVDNLRTLAPKWRVAEFNQRKRAATRKYREKALQAATELDRIEACQNLTVDDGQKCIDFIGTIENTTGKKFIERRGFGHRSTVNRAAWQAYIDQQVARIPKLEEIHGENLDAYNEAIDAAEVECLDVYVD
ncbi:hypothetical protein V7x_54870 [Crateriforma conspicua]|uniref:Uncharacterized protein n=1 Tax=Crateriforma conspicua TaxID=2527996 RepID=A0A5C6FE14_9PLAN|nr:hypothetical protein [Crateriforma conspicua]TWU59713.1 hypothetical protein V7x_54870 [Crateriforma conspicua]